MSKALENRLADYRRILDAVHDGQNAINDVIDTVADLVDQVHAEDDLPFTQDGGDIPFPLFVQKRRVTDSEGNCSMLTVGITPADFIKVDVNSADDPDDGMDMILTPSEAVMLRVMLSDALRALKEKDYLKNSENSSWVEF